MCSPASTWSEDVRRSTLEADPFSSRDIQNVWTTLGFASSTARRADLPPTGIDSPVAVKVAQHALSLASPMGQVIDNLEKIGMGPPGTAVFTLCKMIS